MQKTQKTVQGRRNRGGGDGGPCPPPIICTNMLYCSLQRSVILKKLMCAPPPQSVKKFMCAPPPPHPICNCFLRACSVVHWKTHYLNPISLHVTITHCNRWENSIKLKNALLYKLYCQSKNLHFLHFLNWYGKPPESLGCVCRPGHLIFCARQRDHRAKRSQIGQISYPVST